MRRAVIACVACAALAGCYTVRAPLPDTKAVSHTAKRTWQTKKEGLKTKHTPAAWPESLGGLLQSDEWTLYKDKEQEEFNGHVFYDNGVYTFKAGHARSDRKHKTVTARGNVYLKEQQTQDTSYQAQADWGTYHYQTGQGRLRSTSKNPVKLILTEPAQTVTATAKQVDFDTTARVFTLTGNVQVTRTTQDGTQTLQADKMTLRQDEDYIHLDGNAVLSDGLRTLHANSVVYNGAQDQAHATGARPLVTGSAEPGSFAVIADEISSDAQGNVIQLNGRVQGWLVSPQLNEHKLNSQF